MFLRNRTVSTQRTRETARREQEKQYAENTHYDLLPFMQAVRARYIHTGSFTYLVTFYSVLDTAWACQLLPRPKLSWSNCIGSYSGMKEQHPMVNDS